MDDSIWKDDDHGIVEAGDVGGDIQVGKAYSRRFVHSRLERPEVTGLPGHMERDVIAAYSERKRDDIVYAITDVTPDEEYTYRVKITNRTGYAPNDAGPVFHTEEFGLYPDGLWHGIPVNPHPGYEHWPAFCPNCGY